MKSTLFPKQDLLDLIDGDSKTLTLISNDVTESSRWSIHHYLIFKDADGRVYSVHYSRGATEMQDEVPFEGEGDLISCTCLKPVKKTVTVYVEE